MAECPGASPENHCLLSNAESVRVYPREEHTNWWFSIKWPTLKTVLHIRLHRLNRLCIGKYMYIQIYRHEIEFNANEPIDIKWSKGAYMAGLGEEMGKGEMMSLYYHIKN